MPFDYQKFDAACAQMNTAQLLAQHKHYSKLSAGAATSTAVSALSIPLTLGLSGVAIGLSAPAHHNAKKKKLIVEKYLKARGIEADQAAQYYSAVAADQNQKMWMDQQQQQQQAWNAEKAPMGGDQKYNYNVPDTKSEKKNGPPPSSDHTTSPPPPTYNEALSGASTSSPSPNPAQQQQQQQQYTQPQQRYNSPPPQQQQYNQDPYSNAMYMPPPQWQQQQQQQRQQQPWDAPQSPQGYGGGYGYGGMGPQGYCAPQYAMPPSAMYQGRPAGAGPDPRHVHFSPQVQQI